MRPLGVLGRIPADPLEQQHGQLRLGDEVQMVHAADGLGDFARGRERLLHGLAVLVGAVRGEAEPQW